MQNLTLELIKNMTVDSTGRVTSRPATATPVSAQRVQHVAPDGRVTALLETRKAAPMNTITDRQEAFMSALLDGIAEYDAERAAILRTGVEALREIGDLTKAAAMTCISTLIRIKDELKAAAPKVAPLSTTVPAGRYCLDSVHGKALVFYRVDHGKNGEVYVLRQVGPSFLLVSPREAARAVLARIEAYGVVDAATRYGRELGVCQCGRELTNAASRAAGIGPICARKG